MKPEEVAAEAERRAAEHPGVPVEDRSAAALEASEEDVRDRLTRWAFIEVDAEEVVRSTRWFGAPITWLKRLLARGLRQYLWDQNTKATRFNLQMVAYTERLEHRISELEKRLEEAGLSRDPKPAGTGREAEDSGGSDSRHSGGVV